LSYLFVDSTYDLTLGILDDGYEWLAFRTISGQKASAIIQKEVHALLENLNLSAEALSGIITINGPGFYTGLRLAEGFADVFHYFGVPHYSFYSYEVPLWCGVSEGIWFTKAYRGEYFFYHWNGTDSRQELVDLKSLEKNIKPGSYFIHSEASLDSVSAGLIPAPVITQKLLEEHPQDIFKHVLGGKLSRELFYFRAPEDEFKVNP
jgi:tRNA threonylcarbamoyladenosine biosynthesis protein TsaB